MTEVDRELYRRVRAIFDEVAGQPVNLWAELVDNRCGTDARLRTEVTSLLAAHRDAHDPLLGRTIEGYRIDSALGLGGMGRVYAATQIDLNREVAVKVMSPFVDGAIARRCLASEAELLARLRHPGIAHVYSAGVTVIDGVELAYFAMELIREAQTITDYAEAAGLSIRDRIRLFMQVCAAVEHGHQAGVVHRDLKPPNILVDARGDAKVIDFGIARAVHTKEQLTSLHTVTGAITGTLHYMSPEQFSGDAALIDHRSDIYSLGVVLCELLCGRRPYDLRGLGLLPAIQVVQTGPLLRPSSFDARLRGDLDAIVLRCLSKNPVRRFPSAAALARDLGQHLAGAPIDSRTPGGFERAVQWCRFRPVAAVSLGAALILVSIAITVALVLRSWSLAPADVVVAADGAAAYLVSRSGKTLHSWETGVAGQIVGAQIVTVPSPIGRVIVVGFRKDARSEYHGHICAFAVERPDELVFSTATSPLPPSPRGVPDDGGSFNPWGFLIDDFFSDLPGPEIAVVHRYDPYSQSAIRIFDFAGTLRYEVWHDGVVGRHGEGIMYRPELGQLVLCGKYSEATWGERGFPDLPDVAGPEVVFALEPVDGHRVYLPGIVSRGAIRDQSVAWYRWFGPADQMYSLGCKRSSLFFPRDASQIGHVGWRVFTNIHTAIAPEINFVLDTHGRDVDRYGSDEFRTRAGAGEIPNLEVYAALDYTSLPPVVAGTAEKR